MAGHLSQNFPFRLSFVLFYEGLPGSIKIFVKPLSVAQASSVMLAKARPLQLPRTFGFPRCWITPRQQNEAKNNNYTLTCLSTTVTLGRLEKPLIMSDFGKIWALDFRSEDQR